MVVMQLQESIDRMHGKTTEDHRKIGERHLKDLIQANGVEVALLPLCVAMIGEWFRLLFAQRVKIMFKCFFDCNLLDSDFI